MFTRKDSLKFSGLPHGGVGHGAGSGSYSPVRQQLRYGKSVGMMMGQLGRKFLKGKNSCEASGSPTTARLFTHIPSRLCKLFCLFLVAASLSACFSERWAWNQKLTVVVDTPTGPVSGSSVVEVAWNEVNSVGNYPASYKGEATVLELAGGRYLFALIGESAKHLAFRTIEVKADRMGETLFAEMAASEGKSAAVPRKYYPLLVTFDDIDDPASVKRVDPANLAASFGPGYALKSITLEITDEPVTEGKVEEVLGDLEEIGKQRPTLIPNPPKSRSAATDPDIQYLSVGAFSTELYK